MTKKRNTPKGMGNIKRRRMTAAVILLLAAVIPAAGYGIFHSYYSKMNIRPLETSDVIRTDARNGADDAKGSDDIPADDDADFAAGDFPEELPRHSEDVYNVLLIGTDGRHTGQDSRSDTMMIVSVNRKTQKIIMTSVMRDIYCTVPGVGNTRINHAHACGGAALLLDTIEYNFGIPIDDYVAVDFYGFMDAVDAVGGVPMGVSAGEIKWINFYVDELNTLLGEDADTDLLSGSDAGELVLNGKQALAYSRVRYVGNADFERTSRQREVLTAMMEKAKTLSLPELNSLMNTVLPCVTTNLTQGEVLSLLLHAGEYLGYEVDSGRIPVDGSWRSLNIRGMEVLGIDFDANREYWLERVYGE